MTVLKLKNWPAGKQAGQYSEIASPGADLFGLQTLAEKLSTVCCAKISYVYTILHTNKDVSKHLKGQSGLLVTTVRLY